MAITITEEDFPAHIFHDATYTYISTPQVYDPDVNVAYWKCQRITKATGTSSWRKNAAGVRTPEYVHTADTDGSGEY